MDENCPFSNNEKEGITNLFKNCSFCKDIWSKILPDCPTPLHTYMYFIDLLENVWNNRKIYNKIFLMAIEKIIIIT